MIVDDVKSNRAILSRALARRFRSCEITQAEDGQQALDLLAASSVASASSTSESSAAAEASASSGGGGSYDAVLMDAQMPVMDGYQATQRMRSELGYAGLIIGVTGNALAEDQQLFLRAGADAVFSKPVNVAALSEQICRRLGEKAGADDIDPSLDKDPSDPRQKGSQQ